MPALENSPNQGVFLPNQNLMHVKFHANKYQDNLLSKRLQKLDTEEMKSRLKHQRTSNELILFLRECKKTTGYFSKMKSFQSNSLIVCDDENKEIKNSKSTFESKSSLDIVNPSTKIRSNSYSTQGLYSKDFDVPKQRKKFSLDETKLLKNKQKLLFERILNSGDSSPINSSSSRSQLTTSSKSSRPESNQELSDRSSTSLSSNSSDSFEIFKLSEKKIRPITSQLDSRPRIIKPNTDNNSNNNFIHESTKSHLEWDHSRISLDLSSLKKRKNYNEDNLSRKSSSTNTTETKSVLSRSKKSEFMSQSPKFSDKLPDKASKNVNINPPIRINMCRSSIKKKQLEIMNEYNRSTELELINNLRKIQKDIDNRVKQFTQKNLC